MKRSWLFFCAAMTLVLVISGCRAKIYNDGTYRGVSQADDQGYAVAEITVEKDRIKSVKLTEFTQLGVEKDLATYPYPKAKEANAEMQKRFTGRSDNKVDTYTGATVSSRKYIEAVGFALEKARKRPSVKTMYFDGTFFGRSRADDQGYGVAWVTIKGDRITAVKLEEVTRDNAFKNWQEYPYPVVAEARAGMEKRFVDKNGPDVDVYTGATVSSKKWIEAVANALLNAKAR